MESSSISVPSTALTCIVIASHNFIDNTCMGCQFFFKNHYRKYDEWFHYSNCVPVIIYFDFHGLLTNLTKKKQLRHTCYILYTNRESAPPCKKYEHFINIYEPIMANIQLEYNFRSKCLGANSEFYGARNLLKRYHWTTLI